MEAGRGGPRHRDGSVSARRGQVPAHACLPRRARAAWTPFSIITRGPLVVRDVDVLQEASARAGAEVFLSLPTLDDRVWRTTEPGTAPPASRLEAVRRLAAAGIDVSVGLAPILPGLSDDQDCSKPSFAPRRRRAHEAIWTASCTSAPVCASTSWRLSRGTGRTRLPATRSSSRRAPTWRGTTGPILEPVRRARGRPSRAAFSAREPRQLARRLRRPRRRAHARGSALTREDQAELRP